MNKTAFLIIGALAAVLSGCDDAPSPAEEAAYVDEEAGSTTRAQLAEDQKDLDATVKELQSKDPSVKDAYYSYNEKGEKVLHIVREEANGQNSDSVWPMLGGAAVGALAGYALAKSMNSQGGYSNYQKSYPPMSQAHYDEEERRKRRNTSSAIYTNTMMNNNRGYVRQAPTYRQNMTARTTQTRSSFSSSGTTSRASGVMSGGGARAASHGGSSASS